MLNKLKYESNFIPTIIKNNDQYFSNNTLIINVTKLISEIRAHPGFYNRQKLRVETYWRPCAKINEKHVPYVDLSVPIIIAEVRPFEYVVIDGHHRLEKAHRNGVYQLDGYVLPPEQYIRFIATKESYKNLIAHWNSKF